MRDQLIDWREHIYVDKNILSGKPLINGTLIPVDLILELLSHGWSENRIIETYPALSHDDIKAVYKFLKDSLEIQIYYRNRVKEHAD